MQQLIVKTKPHDLICITTDAMEATGQGPGRYEMMGGVVWVDDEVAYREDRTRHAGSILTMDRGVRNVVAAGASVASALMMASEVPARTIGAVCRCGPTLVSPGDGLSFEPGTVTCARCGRRYEIAGQHVREVDGSGQ